MVKRRQRQWEAQPIVLLLAHLAHHLLVWAKWWLSREPATRRRLRGYGLVRLLQEVGTVPGALNYSPGKCTLFLDCQGELRFNVRLLITERPSDKPPGRARGSVLGMFQQSVRPPGLLCRK